MTNFFKFLYVSLICVFFICLNPDPARSMLLPWAGKVVKIKSGDTLIIEKADQKIFLRLAEIDAPEPNQPFGQDAIAFLKKKCLHKVVTVTPRTKSTMGKIVGYAALGNGDKLHVLLLKNGLAWHYKRYSKNPMLENLQKQAQEQKMGLWVEKNPTPPWEFRKKRIRKRPTDK